MTHAALVTSGLQGLVEKLESLPPTEMEGRFSEIIAEAGTQSHLTQRHLMIASLVAAARSLDWAPFDGDGAFDLVPASVLAADRLWDRLPDRQRAEPGRAFALAVAHRIHSAGENAPYLLPEIAPDPDRMKDPSATYAEVDAALDAGAVTRALHAWPCCRARAPWSKVTDTIARLALRDGVTGGNRLIAATTIRRYLEIGGREHRHPVITALFRALACSPRGEDPASLRDAALEGVAEPDAHRSPEDGDEAPAGALAEELLASGEPEVVAAHRIAGGAALGAVLEGVALAACELGLAREGDDRELSGWVGDTLVAVNACRELDGLENGHVRPRVVVEAARLLGVRRAEAERRGATWGARAPTSPDADDPLLVAERIQLLDSRSLDPGDLGSLRLHVAATDEYRRATSPGIAARFFTLTERAGA